MVDHSFYKQNTMPDLISGEEEIPVPDKIGPYAIESLFAKGGMSLLYLGFNPEEKKTVVVKVLSPSYVNCPHAVGQFIKEAQIISLTDHPHIVKLYAQGEWEHGFYIAMELIRGVSLKQFILQHSLSLKRALEIILQVAHALHHLHSHGVIHRDLKPENILITEEGDVKVIDFGIAQLHEETAQGIARAPFVGTPNYMSPEQKEHPAQVTFASDIFSLGVILYELILGKLSYGLITLTGLPKKLKAILSKALAISPSERYQNLSDFIGDISLYLKSGSLDKEKPSSDQIKEVQEELQKASQTLICPQLPDWPQMDLGVAKTRGMMQMGLYLDCFRLPDNTYLLILGAPTISTLSASVPMSFLKGLVRGAIHAYEVKEIFSLTLANLATRLNDILILNETSNFVALSLTRFDPMNNALAYLSCGMPPLLHLSPESKTTHLLSSENPLLGAVRGAIFSETLDKWEGGDLVIIHSLHIPVKKGVNGDLSLSALLQEALLQNSLLSAQPQAEALLKAATQSSAYPLITCAKALLSIQRLSY